VNKMTNNKKGIPPTEVSRIPTQEYQIEKNLSIEIFNPEGIIEQARRAADALKKVVESKPKKVIINGEQFLEFEDWQTLGYFYGFTVETGGAKEIIREGKIVGYEAKSTVYRSGIKVGGAEASCLRTEKNWQDKPEFQLKSMSQTRAAAKGLRNVLAWVAVLAGYKPTPAEEMTGQETDNGKCQYCGTVGKYHKKGCPALAKEELDVDKIDKNISQQKEEK